MKTHVISAAIFSGLAAQPLHASNCSGGSVDLSVTGYVIHAFTSNGTLNCPSERTAEVVVAGGGGGAKHGGAVAAVVWWFTVRCPYLRVTARLPSDRWG